MTWFYYEKGLWWFRIFGYGLHCKNTKYRELIFSQRNGYSGYKIGSFLFRILTPEDYK